MKNWFQLPRIWGNVTIGHYLSYRSLLCSFEKYANWGINFTHQETAIYDNANTTLNTPLNPNYLLFKIYKKYLN